MSELTETRWQDTKSALLEGLTGNKKAVMAATLENTKAYLAEAATAGATSAGNVATLNRVILPVIRRVMPTVIANELVGVQPMTGPVGQIHTLGVRSEEQRLNSSHITISYAVFCLKKKNQTVLLNSNLYYSINISHI